MKVGLPARKMDRVYTYRDYKDWPDDERWELIRGVAWNMSPAPSVNHQTVLVSLTRIIATHVRGTGCRLLVAPTDVILPSSPDQDEDDVDTVVQPDLLVVCDPDKVGEKWVRGAPDWVIEILSPYTTRKDLGVKLELYEEQSVREYWIVDPGNRCVHVYRRGEDGRYGEAVVHVAPAEIASVVCPGLLVRLGEVL